MAGDAGAVDAAIREGGPGGLRAAGRNGVFATGGANFARAPIWELRSFVLPAMRRPASRSIPPASARRRRIPMVDWQPLAGLAIG